MLKNWLQEKNEILLDAAYTADALTTDNEGSYGIIKTKLLRWYNEDLPKDDQLSYETLKRILNSNLTRDFSAKEYFILKSKLYENNYYSADDNKYLQEDIDMLINDTKLCIENFTFSSYNQHKLRFYFNCIQDHCPDLNIESQISDLIISKMDELRASLDYDVEKINKYLHILGINSSSENSQI